MPLAVFFQLSDRLLFIIFVIGGFFFCCACRIHCRERYRPRKLLLSDADAIYDADVLSLMMVRAMVVFECDCYGRESYPPY